MQIAFNTSIWCEHWNSPSSLTTITPSDNAQSSVPRSAFKMQHFHNASLIRSPEMSSRAMTTWPTQACTACTKSLSHRFPPTGVARGWRKETLACTQTIVLSPALRPAAKQIVMATMMSFAVSRAECHFINFNGSYWNPWIYATPGVSRVVFLKKTIRFDSDKYSTFLA